MTLRFSKVEVTNGIDKGSFSGEVEIESLADEAKRNGRHIANLCSFAVK